MNTDISIRSDFVEIMRRGEASPENFRKYLKSLENKHVPVDVKVKRRLEEIHLQVQDFIEPTTEDKRTMSLGEWKHLRKLTRRGAKIATHFKKKDSAGFFGTLLATANYNIRLSTTT